MRILIPSFDTVSTDRALAEACRIVQPGDQVIVMAPVIVPGDLPVDVGAGSIWRRTCEAEQRLFHAREAAERALPRTVDLRIARVQARDHATAILTGATRYAVDLILLAMRDRPRRTFAMRFGTFASVRQHARCDVRIVDREVDGTPQGAPVRVARPRAILHAVPVNRSPAEAPTENGARQPEEQHAS